MILAYKYTCKDCDLVLYFECKEFEYITYCDCSGYEYRLKNKPVQISHHNCEVVDIEFEPDFYDFVDLRTSGI